MRAIDYRCRLRALLAAALIALAVTLVTGCAHSPPTQYFTLNAVAPATTVTGNIRPLQLTAVHIPPELDRQEVVVGLSGTRLLVDNDSRWGAPLADLMRRSLAQDLLQRLPSGAFVLPDSPAPGGTRSLVVTVLQASTDADKVMTVQASWTLIEGQDAAQKTTRFATLTSAVGAADTATQVATLSRLFGRLADLIAASAMDR
ncbi:PqiC family protein [Paraburkholderia fynbosensis]|nr:PqiC family protein [Paraburkholderia fynbosensis]